MIFFKRKHNKEFFKWMAFIFLLTLPQFLYVYAFFIEPNWIKLEKIKVTSPRLAKALEGIKVIQVSDVEIQDIGYREISVIELISKIEPDLILITGDLINERRYLQSLLNFLSLLGPRFHTYLILGDEDGTISDLKDSDIWKNTDASFIDGKAIRLNLKGKEDSYFWLVGVSDIGTLVNLTKDIPKNEPLIVMSHHPDTVKPAALIKTDIVLAGHTQGGQVGIPVLRKIFPYAQRSVYISGLYKVRDTLLYVNRGITSDKSIRFLCRPEVTLFDFTTSGRSKKPKVLRQDE